MQMERILVINPGSTSTKIAVYEDEKELFTETVTHTEQELKPFTWVMEQLDFRKKCVIDTLVKHGVEPKGISCVMARGGMLPPCEAGAYQVNQTMIDYMNASKIDTHISNVACAVAYAIAQEANAPAYVYDPVTVDELTDIARITGIPEISKQSRGHALNTHAMAYKCAEEVMKKPITECTFIVQHLGGGTSVWLIDKGKAIDMYSDDDAGFAPERCGKIQAMPLIKLCFSGKYDYKQMTKLVRGNAGLRAHLGTADARDVEKMIADGDEYAKLIYEAFAYGVAKGIGDLATVVNGKVDRIILTGGIAYSKMITDMVRARVEFIAPVEIMAGEHEMEALAQGGLRVMRGQETAHKFLF